MSFRILMITNSLGMGGAEKMFCFVANGLQQLGNTVCVADLGTEQVYGTPHTLNDEIKVYKIKQNPQKGIKRLTQIAQLKSIARQNKVDAILGFTGMPNVLATIVSLVTHRVSIVCERGDPSRTISSGIVDQILLSIVNKASGAVFQIDEAKHYYSENLQKHCAIIPNPVFYDAEIKRRPFAERNKTVLSIGRLANTQKRYDIMIKAFAIFHQKHKNYQLYLYGDGPDKGLIESFICESNLNDCILIKGPTECPLEIMAREGIFLITSDYEGISNSMLEALSVGMPVVSTDSSPGGARMVIENNKNGILVRTGDIDEIAYALASFADDEQFAEACSNEAMLIKERFSPNLIIKQWDDFIQSLVTNK